MGIREQGRTAASRTKGTLHRLACGLGLHQWRSEPRVTWDEYGLDIDHYCDHCGAERFDRLGNYAHGMDRAQARVHMPIRR